MSIRSERWGSFTGLGRTSQTWQPNPAHYPPGSMENPNPPAYDRARLAEIVERARARSAANGHIAREVRLPMSRRVMIADEARYQQVAEENDRVYQMGLEENL